MTQKRFFWEGTSTPCPPPKAYFYATRPYAVTRFSNAMVYDSLWTARRELFFRIFPGRMIHKWGFLKRSIKINPVTFCECEWNIFILFTRACWPPLRRRQMRVAIKIHWTSDTWHRTRVTLYITMAHSKRYKITFEEAISYKHPYCTRADLVIAPIKFHDRLKRYGPLRVPSLSLCLYIQYLSHLYRERT